ncbi:MAG TPA: cyclic nucleotide-binding domain-containing protein [Trichocoleus sp.]
MNELYKMSERQMHLVRWALTVAWLVMIVSLFWDPISPYLADPANPLSPFRLDPSQCVSVQGACLEQQPYAIASYLFWTFVVPGSILVLLVFGHETWRRICPLSFLSQIPRALGIQRKRQVQSSSSGATRYELVKIRKDSWLAKNHLYVQFVLLSLGLVARLLFLNSSRVLLGLFLLLTIGCAIAIGYLYAGKSWCQYFCPMAPVQLVFTGLRGLLGSEAHQGTQQAITQSMCRTVDSDGKEKSACVGCQSPCIDIDAERSYWGTFTQPGRKFVQYGYVGLVIGFFTYYWLYAGNFDYLFSGIWLREKNQLGKIFAPGFYVFGEAIPIPKLVAVPLTLAGFVLLSFYGLLYLEKRYRSYLAKHNQVATKEQVTHIVFSLCTFLCFNLFFFFSSRSVLSLFPLPIHLLFNGFIVLVSTLWLSRTLSRSSDIYNRESLANALRRQLSKLSIDFSRFLEGRSMNDLKAEEVYVLAKVIPGVSQEQSLQVYKGVLRETLEQGTADSASSLEFLRPIRQELNIKDEDHFTVLTELSSIDPDLLDPKRRHTRENQLRIASYRQALGSMLFDLVDSGISLQEAMQRQKKQIQFLKLEYGMTTEEEDEVLSQILAGEKQTILRKADVLKEQMRALSLRDQTLSNLNSNTYASIFKLLRLIAVQHKQEILTKQMLGLLEMLQDAPEAVDLARTTCALAGTVLRAMLQTSDCSLAWKQRLAPEVWTALDGKQPELALEPELTSQAETQRISKAKGSSKELQPKRQPQPQPLEGSSEIIQDSSLVKNALHEPQSLVDVWALLEDNQPESALDGKQNSVSISSSDDLKPEDYSLRHAALNSMASKGMEPNATVPNRPKLTGSSVNKTKALVQAAEKPLSSEPLELTNLSMPQPASSTLHSLVEVLSDLLHDLDPLIRSLAVYALNVLDAKVAYQRAKQLLDTSTSSHWLVQETLQNVLSSGQPDVTQMVQTLIAQIVIADKVENRLFQKPVIRIGRSKANDIVIPDPTLALHHAVIYLEQDTFSVLDLVGNHGLFVDNQLVQGECKSLEQGQCIRFGKNNTPSVRVYWEKQPFRTPSLAETMSTLDKALLLFESQFFQSLKPDVLVELGRNALVKVYPHQASLCEADDPSDSILLLIDGTAHVTVPQGNTKQVVGIVHAGETIGEMGVLTRQHRSASVIVASEFCRALVIQADAFDAVLRQDPEVARNLLIILSSRLQNMTQKVASFKGVAA